MCLHTELDKSSSDIAAEGAILNEMLEIVAKRAALRPADTIAGQLNETNDSEVSLKFMRAHKFRRRCGLAFVFLQFFFIYACIIYFANYMMVSA